MWKHRVRKGKVPHLFIILMLMIMRFACVAARKHLVLNAKRSITSSISLTITSDLLCFDFETYGKRRTHRASSSGNHHECVRGLRLTRINGNWWDNRRHLRMMLAFLWYGSIWSRCDSSISLSLLIPYSIMFFLHWAASPSRFPWQYDCTCLANIEYKWDVYWRKEKKIEN